MTPTPSCSLPWHNILDYSVAGENEAKVAADMTVTGSQHLASATSNSARSALVSSLMAGNTCISQMLPQSKGDRSVHTSGEGMANEACSSYFSQSNYPLLEGAPHQNGSSRRLQPFHRNAITAAEINKLHQAVKLFRLLPPKTQMILKQVHPEGPLNSDIFAAIMAATECVPQPDASFPDTYSKGTGARDKHSRSRQNVPLCMTTIPHASMHHSIPCKTSGPNDAPTYTSATAASTLLSGSLGTSTTLNCERPVREVSSWLERSTGTSTNSMTPAQIQVAEKNIPAGGLGAQTHGPLGANVFVFHIPNEWVERDLALHFAQFGPILSARIAADKVSGRRLGFGFVSFTTVAAARSAVESLNGFSVAGKRLKVTIKRGEQQYAAAVSSDNVSMSRPNTAQVEPPAPSPRGDQPSLNSVVQETAAQNGGDSGGSSTDTSQRSKFSRSTRDEVGSSVPTGLTTTEDSSAKAGLSDFSSNPRRHTKTAGVCEQCRKATVSDRSHMPSRRCAGVIALKRLQVVKKVLTKLYKRIGSDTTPLPDEMWLETLTDLLRTEPGRYFIFTLLMAAGLDLEMEHGLHQEDDEVSSTSTESSGGFGSPS